LRRATIRRLISPDEASLLSGQIEQLLPQLNAYLRWLTGKISEEKGKAIPPG
jgi:hypothetical protein